MSKKMKLVFCLLVSVFLVTQVLAVEPYLLVSTDKGIRIYLVPDKDKMKKKWDDPVLTLEEGKRVISAEFNTNSTILCALLEDSSPMSIRERKFIFYKIPIGGTPKDIYKTNNSIPAEWHDGGAFFNPIDGTFYSYNERTNTLKVFDVKDDAMHFKCKFKHPTPGGIVLNPKDPRTIIFLYYGKGESCFEIRRLPPNGDLNSSILKRTVSCNPHLGGGSGFDPSGEVFFFSENTDNNFKVHFYKIQKGEAEEFHEIDLGKETFSFFTPRSHKCGFLDSSHFYVCVWMGVRIYEFAPPCNQWTKNSMPEVSFTKIKTLATDVKCYDAVMFSPEKVMQFSPKALKKFKDVRIHTEN